MYRTSVIMFVMVVAMFGLATATIIHVPDSYGTIQAGINASVNGDTVLVASGTYHGNFNFIGRNIVLMSESGPDLTILEPTVASTPLVRFSSNEGSGAILKGFTLQNMSGNAGVYISNHAGPQVIGNKFKNCISVDGAGIKIENGNLPSITGNIFAYNIASSTGGAIYSVGTAPNIDNNQFIGNYSFAHGGAIDIRTANGGSIHHNLFSYNRCGSVGGAVILDQDTSISVFNNTVVSNSTEDPDQAGGISIWYSNSCEVYNNIIAFNSGKGIQNQSSNASTAAYNDLWSNTINYDGITPGDGSISLTPQFKGGDPYDYHICTTSPCLNTGDPASPNDPDGSRCDMGALYPPYNGSPLPTPAIRSRHVPEEYFRIQAAIDGAFNGDTVLVAPGSYVEHFNFGGKSILVVSEEGPAITFLDPLSGNISIVKIVLGEGSSAVLRGFTLENMVNSPALRIENSSPTITGNLFTYNHSIRGAGINIYNSPSPRISNNVFTNCSAVNEGGAIYSDSTAAIIEDNTFYSNSTAGGIVNLYRSHRSQIRRNLFYSNQCTGFGAMVSVSNSRKVDIFNNTLASNSIATGGGIVTIGSSDTCRVYNNIIVNNAATGLYVSPLNRNSAQYNDVWGNGANYNGITPGVGSISLDPYFVGGAPFDYSLFSISPCVNTGDPSAPHDPDNSIADMGALYPPITGQYGYIGGVISNSLDLPINGVLVSISGYPNRDTTDINGRYLLGPFPGGYSFDIQLVHPDYLDTTLIGIETVSNDTTDLDVTMQAGFMPGYLKGVVADSATHSGITDVVVRVDDSGPYDTTTAGYFFIKNIPPGPHVIYFSSGRYENIVINDVMIPIRDTARITVYMPFKSSAFHLIYGNRDGSPMAAPIGSNIDIPVWGATNPQDYMDSVTYMHLPLSSNDSIISSRYGGVLPDTFLGRWDEAIFYAANADLTPGWTNQSMAGFAYIYDPPDPANYFWTGGDTLLICTFRVHIAYDLSLVGDTICPFKEGFHPALGGELWGMQDGMISVVPPTTYPSLVFESPTGCFYVLGDINNSGVTNGLDVVYGVRYLKGGAAPAITCPMCPQTDPFYAAGDVNGSCTFSGLDITYLVRFFKGGPAPFCCPSCPPVSR